MFEKIIISSEPSSHKNDITECMKGFRKIGAKECLLFYCLDAFEGGAKLSPNYQKKLKDYAERQKTILESQGYTVEINIDIGEVEHKINRLAVIKGYSLVVIGGVVQSKLIEKFLGGMEYKIIRYSKIPTLVVRMLEPNEDESLVEKREITDHILFPTDFSENSIKALKLILEMVRSGVKKVTVLHVAEPYVSDNFKSRTLRKLQEYKEDLIKSGAEKVEARILLGKPSDKIINYTEESDTTLVVMGSQGRGFLQEIFIGSVSHDLVRKSPVSVLLVPADR